MPPTPEPFSIVEAPGKRWFLGHVLEFKRNPLETMTLWRERCGDFVRFSLGPKELYLLSHPALAEEVLVKQADVFQKVYDPNRPTGLALVLGNGLLTSGGELWRRQRKLIQPMFQRARVARLSAQMVEAGEQMLARWAQRRPGEPCDVAAEMMQLALEVVTRTMFSTSVLKDVASLGPALLVLIRYAFRAFHNPFRLPLWVPTAANREFLRAKHLVDRLIYGLIEERRRSGVKPDDLLDLLLSAVDAETGTGLSPEQQRDELLTIAAAGHETTANALTWTWYLLASYPAAATRLREELSDVLGGRAPTMDDLPRLPFTRSVFEEALRLYPPAPAVQRRAIKDTTVGGRLLPAGSLVVVSLWNIHRHPGFWKQPERFDPDRFAADRTAHDHHLAFLPFGAGPRTCIGNHFAMVEGVLLLALIAQRYDLTLVPGQKVEIELAVTLRPKNGLPMIVRPRG
ncbi:MAG TPA: cytochrome P450 [Nitrospiraceae bacterium]|nr:cytochrome P450 [Nitrospiraceae bacterium]